MTTGGGPVSPAVFILFSDLLVGGAGFDLFSLEGSGVDDNNTDVNNNGIPDDLEDILVG